MASDSWPLAAQQVMYEAGIEPALRTAADSQPAPGGTALTAAKSSIGPGGTTTLTGTVQNFSTRAITGLTVSLDLPSGWTGHQTTRPATTVSGGAATSVEWQVTAPSTVTDPLTNAAFTLKTSYRSGLASYTSSTAARVAVAGALTSLKSFGSVPSVFGQAGERYAILAGGNDIWGAGGEQFDEYGAVYSPKAAGTDATLTVTVTAQQAVDPWSKAGLVLRNDLAAPGTSEGYVVLVVTPGNGVSLQWQDAATPGYLDQFTSSAVRTVKAPVWLRLSRDGSQVSGFYSTDGTTWTQVGSAVTLTGAAPVEDAGMIATAHSPSAQGEADFSDFS